MDKPVTGLSIPLPILRLHFITKRISIHRSKPKPNGIPAKTYNPTNHIMDNNVYIFLHITLVVSLSTVNLNPNFSESIYIYKCCKLCNDSTNSS